MGAPENQWSRLKTGEKVGLADQRIWYDCLGKGNTIKQEAAKLLGQKIGHIRVVDFIGEGGMGTVYVGFDEKLQRRVALKAIRTEFRLHPETKARFLREARILSQIDHENICTAYEFIEGEHSDFLVLELIRGKNLRQMIQEGQGARQELLAIADQLLKVLAAVHEHGVIHRDLKPENIMLTESGVLKVLDFGLARSVEEEVGYSAADTHVEIEECQLSIDNSTTRIEAGDNQSSSYVQTKLGTVLGTAGYMSPEQAQGSTASAASDIYSTGLILQELFTGRQPFPRSLHAEQLLERAAKAQTLPVEGLPADLTGLIQRMKALAPGGRPSARDAADMLKRVIDRPRKKRRRFLVAAVWILLSAFALGMTVQSMRAARSARQVAHEADALYQRTIDALQPIVVSLQERPDDLADFVWALCSLGRFDEAEPHVEWLRAEEALTPDIEDICRHGDGKKSQ